MAVAHLLLGGLVVGTFGTAERCLSRWAVHVICYVSQTCAAVGCYYSFKIGQHLLKLSQQLVRLVFWITLYSKPYVGWGAQSWIHALDGDVGWCWRTVEFSLCSRLLTASSVHTPDHCSVTSSTSLRLYLERCHSRRQRAGELSSDVKRAYNAAAARPPVRSTRFCIR